MENDGPPYVGRTPLSFGDSVRIRRSAETEVAGIAGRVGQIYGETTPSSTGVVVIGDHRRDYAISVHLGDGEDYWLAEELLEFVDHAPGTTMKVGNASFVRRADGEWEPVDE
jgi:hypothetical protein